jgi:hypothetical protein|tara:strand:- start:8477 stop:8653 length:177 start_codon:yes stop_codon:yes gene_type:complete
LSATRDVVDDVEDDDARVFIASIARAFVRARKPRGSNARERVRRRRENRKKALRMRFI